MKTKQSTPSSLNTTRGVRASSPKRALPLFDERKLVSIDPGAKQMGFAAFLGDSLIDYCIRTIPSVQSIRERLVRMEEVVSRYIDEKNPHALAIEKTAFSQSAQNGIVVLAYYKILAVARRRHLPVYEYAPITVRKLVCGYGRSTKDDVAKILISMYPELRIYRGLDRRFKARLMSDLYDAVAVGVAHIRSHG